MMIQQAAAEAEAEAEAEPEPEAEPEAEGLMAKNSSIASLYDPNI
jgi:hypothetical protein